MSLIADRKRTRTRGQRGRLAAGANESENPAHAHMKQVEDARRLTASLKGVVLPDVELETAKRMRLRLLAHIEGRAVLYFVPGYGNKCQAGIPPTPDALQHLGFADRIDAFAARRVKVVCISSQSLDSLRNVGDQFPQSAFMFSDPELRVGKAVGLPISRGADGDCYERLTLLTEHKRIVRVLYPIAHGEAAGNARQVLTHMATLGWSAQK